MPFWCSMAWHCPMTRITSSHEPSAKKKKDVSLCSKLFRLTPPFSITHTLELTPQILAMRFPAENLISEAKASIVFTAQVALAGKRRGCCT